MEYINLKVIESIKLFFSKKFIKDSEEDFDISKIYTTLSEAREEVWRRWNDEELKEKVDKYLGEIPDVIKDEPKSIIARHIATPNFEFFRFYDLAVLSSLSPLVWEYRSDKYYTVNQDKLCLGKIHFCDKKNKLSMHSKKIIDFKGIEGMPIDKIETKWGQSLVSFHREIFNNFKFKDVAFHDASVWYKEKGHNAEENYKYFLALFIRNGILFENFLSNENEKQFTETVVKEAFKEIRDLFGVSPLIVPISTRDDENEQYWWCYPQEVEKFIK